ncbi:MAG: molybdopterin molybdotransferase MoeA, partial [Opitutales bacterium]|nr:molybdopterin molybdotransferase MoeA [Opitutales bacterium]
VDAFTGSSLRIIGEVPAGTVFEKEISEGECVRIFTGSPIPAGANAVVMQEDTHADKETIEITDGVKPFEHVRLRGEDIKEGEVIGQAGEMVTSGRVALLGACGTAEVSVYRRSVIGLIATGDELKEPGAKLGPGEIFESNRLALARLVEQTGAVPRIFPLVSDTLASTIEALEVAFPECDAVVTSGGVSVGEHDYVKEALERLGGSLDFWKVRIKPGKPFVYGQFGGKPLIGVPGNPVSAFVTFLTLVRPAIMKMTGATDTSLPSHPAKLVAPLVNRGDRRHFMRVYVDNRGSAHPVGLQASHALGSLGKANGLIDVPPETTLPEGVVEQVLRWSM